MLVSWLIGSPICAIAVSYAKISFKGVDSLRATRILGGTIVTEVPKNSLNLNLFLRPVNTRVCDSSSCSVARCITVVMNDLVVTPRMLSLVPSIRVEYDDIVGRISCGLSINDSVIPSHIYDLFIFLVFVLLIIVILAFKQLHLLQWLIFFIVILVEMLLIIIFVDIFFFVLISVIY